MTTEPADQQHAPDASPEGVVLLLQVPRTNEQKELAAEQMFASLHGLLTMPIPKARLFAPTVKRERLSFEIAVIKKRIGFYVWVPEYLKSFVEEQIYAQYPTVQISEIPDYTMNDEQMFPTTLVTEMKLVTNDVLPIKTFQSFEVDPLAAITATLAKFDEDEEAWVQLVMKPAASDWHHKTEKYLTKMRGAKTSTTGLLTALWAPPEVKSEPAKLAEHEQLRATNAETKSQKLAFETQLRIVYRGHAREQEAKLRLQSIIASYKQFNTTYLNGFEAKRIVDDLFLTAAYRSREFVRSGYSLNIEEVATLYHLPHTNVQTPYILWASSQTAEPPANLPIVTSEHREDISPVAATNFRGHNTIFGLPRNDRSRHLYIVGQTGVGKSGLLELLTISDIYSPYGFAVIDPHGDYAQNVLRRIPAERADDVIYFNPADTDFPIAFNPMEVLDPKLKTHTASELIGVLKRMFESWGPRLEYILRYSLLALLDYPEATMLDITRILTDKKFRNEVLTHVGDPVVRNFWQVEFASWNDKFAAEAVAPVLNKVGAFTANPLVRNIIGQPKSSFNIRQIMDERKILVVNLTRGLVGEDNAALLGALLVTKVQLGAMSRADIHGSERTPFYLYVDEFQNFATDSFATILSEARKYGLNLTVANQYIAQMPIEVKDAVFGNVGSIVAFRMSADDARSMLRYFEPKFEEYDLIHMHNRHFVISMTIDGEKVPAFSAISLNLPPQGEDNTAYIVDRSRARYASSREFVERFVHERYMLEGKSTKDKKEAAPRPKPVAKVEPAKNPLRPSIIAHAALVAEIEPPRVQAAESAKQSTQPKEAKPEPVAVAPVKDVALAETAEPSEKPKKRRRRRKRKSSNESEAGRRPTEEATTAEKPIESPKPKPAPAHGIESNPPPKAEAIKKPEQAPKSDAPQDFESAGIVHLK
jgi:hypothetical protein